SVKVYLNAPANPNYCRYQLAFARDDGSGNPGAFFYKTPVLEAAPGTGWNSVPMVSDPNGHVLVQGDPFYIFYLQVGEPPECPSLAYDDTLDQPSVHWRYLAGGTYQPYAPPGDLMIRAFVSHGPVANAPNDARARFVSEPLYEFVPRPAGTPVPLSALVDNFGTNSLSDIAVTCSILGAGGALRYTETQTVATMAPLEEVLVTFTPWNPLTAERCSVIVHTDLGNVTPDDIPENDDVRFTCDIVPVAFTGSSPGNYAWIDSDTLGGPVYDWVDTTGAFVAISVGDEQRIYVPIGFNFPYYDTTYNNVYVCTNGWLSLGTDQGITAPNNRPLPNLDPPNRCLYPWWDNLEVGPAFGGKVWYKNDGVAPNRRFIVIWSNAHRIGTDSTDLLSFEAILHENGSILFQYQDATIGDLYYDNGRAISVGLENPDGTDGLNYIYSVPPLSGTRNYPGNRISAGRAIKLFKQYRDAAALDIIQPETYTFPGTIYPQARIQNYGTVGDTITAYMSILPGAYYDTLVVEGIAPGAETTVVFSKPWDAVNGSYVAACSVDMAGDAVLANNVFSKIVIVSPWVQRETIPSGIRKRKVKNSSLVYAPSTNRLYALKGGNTNEFWSYDIATGTWETLASMPLVPSGSKAKDGCDLAYDAFHGSAGWIWALKGKRTDFYYYDIAGDSWVARAPALPRGQSLKVPGKGAAIAFVPSIGPEGAVYCALGNLSLYFLHYDVAADTWRRTHDVPFFPLNKRSVKAGGDMVYDGDSLLYLLKGSNTTELWAYSPAVDSWLAARTHNPVSLLGTRNRRVKAGGAMAFLDGTIYVLKGGNTQQFWSYTIGAGDSWIQRADLPFSLTGRRARPKRGASMAGVDSTIFCLKGSYGYEFWEYKPAADPVGLYRQGMPEREGVMAGPGVLSTGISVWPNPGRPGIRLDYSLPEPAHVRLRIYDAAGKLVRDLLDAPARAGRHTVRWDGNNGSGQEVAAGIYFVKLEAGDAVLARKLVLQR
ncbi:MAG: FlgD immunoglobulin-like domain containing protein, partial [candidate division WOR-3 bacterium]